MSLWLIPHPVTPLLMMYICRMLRIGSKIDVQEFLFFLAMIEITTVPACETFFSLRSSRVRADGPNLAVSSLRIAFLSFVVSFS